MGHETPSVSLILGRIRADHPSSRPPLPPCVYAASLPSSAPKRSGPATLPDRRRPGPRRPDRPLFSGRSPGGAWTACNPGPRPPRPSTPRWPKQDEMMRLAAPVPARPQANQPVDVAPGRSGLLRKGLDAWPAQRRDHPPGPQTSGRRLEARQALADQPRPGVLAKKLRDQLIQKAASRPDWASGFQDETWWTRLAQPDLFAWPAEQPLRLSPNERGGGGGVLACYGLLCRHGGDAAAFRRGPAGQSGD